MRRDGTTVMSEEIVFPIPEDTEFFDADEVSQTVPGKHSMYV